MSERLHRLAAIVRADFLIRLRRPSTVVVFLLLSAIPYLWIPNPATGRALMQIGGKRALYNSATIGMATATLGAMFIGLAGFYVISNALRRDILSRCGYVIASTTMRGSEYIIGKFAGNVVFLSVFGATSFDAAKGTLDFAGLHVTPYWIATRVAATLWPISLLGVARLFFHRFDPARVRAVPNEKARRSWVGRLNLISKPIARLFVRVLSPFAARPAVTDALATIAAFPLVAIGMIAFAIATLSADNAQDLFTGVLPVAFAACAIAIADIASREKRAGTTALVFAAPGLRTRFVWWKFTSTLIVALAFLAVPLASAIRSRPHMALALLVGVAFTAAASTALGILSSNPKTFIVGFLTFWYIAIQDKGLSPALDFAGWFGTATPTVIATYALMGLGSLALAQLFHANELRRKW